MRVLHFETNDRIRSVLISSLKPNVEYTVEIDRGFAVQIQVDENSFKVEGADWFLVQDGDNLILYDVEDNEKEVIPTSEIGYYVRTLYHRGNAKPITAYAWLEVIEPKPLPARLLWLPDSPFPIYTEVGGPSAIEEKDMYLVVSADGRIVATKAICSSMLQELGLRYKAEGEEGYLDPVYSAKEDGRRYEVVCLTCLRGLEWAVAFRREKWIRLGVEYDTEVFTPNGHLTYDSRSVYVPGFGELDLEEWHEKAKEQCNKYMLTHGWIQLR